MERLPIRGGVSLNPSCYEDIVSQQLDIGWFAVRAEQYLGLGGPAHQYLEKIAANYPLSLQCPSLSIGSAESVNNKHLQDVLALIQRYAPCHVTTSLSWCRWQGAYFVESLPLPYTEESLDQVTMNVRSVQSALGRSVYIENPATLFRLDGNTISEGEFLSELVRNTGCGIALDVGNLYVSSQNTSTDPFKALNDYPLAAVREIQISGHSLRPLDDQNILLIADHQPHITKPVWQLLKEVLHRLPHAIPTLVEWNDQTPNLPLLIEQMQKVDQTLADYEQSAGVRAI